MKQLDNLFIHKTDSKNKYIYASFMHIKLNYIKDLTVSDIPEKLTKML